MLPFLENVTRGRGIPRERLEEVGEHYYAFGGRSPINDQNRAFIAAVEEDLASAGIDLPVYWGNRNWDPYLADTLRQMRDDGISRAACLVTSAYSSYSGCRQYRENLADAVAPTVPGAPRLDRLRHYFNHPGFVEPMVDATLTALAGLGDAARRDAHVLFVTHSIPTSMNDTAGPEGNAYVAQHRAVADEVAERVRQETGHRYPTELVFCSRSGPPHVPWLEPDVNDRIEELAEQGVGGSRRGARSASCPTTWRSSTTSTPRRGRPPRRSASSSPGPRPPGSTRASSRWSATCSSSGWPSSGATRSAGPGRCAVAVVGPLPGRLLPQPARRPPRAVRAGLTCRPRRTTSCSSSPSGSPSRPPRWSGCAASRASRSSRPSPARSTSSPRSTARPRR